MLIIFSLIFLAFLYKKIPNYINGRQEKVILVENQVQENNCFLVVFALAYFSPPFVFSGFGNNSVNFLLGSITNNFCNEIYINKKAPKQQLDEIVQYLSDLDYESSGIKVEKGLKTTKYGRLNKNEDVDMFYRLQLTIKEIEYNID